MDNTDLKASIRVNYGFTDHLGVTPEQHKNKLKQAAKIEQGIQGEAFKSWMNFM